MKRPVPMLRLLSLVSLLAAVLLVAAGAESADANVVERHLGVDSCANESVGRMQTLYTNSSYGTYGFYIGGITANLVCPYTASFHNFSWVASVTGQGWDLLPIYSGRQPGCVPGQGQSYPIDPNPSVAYNQGVSAGSDAIGQAYSRGMFGPILLDVDVDVPTGYSCAGTTDAFERGFIDQIATNSSYIAGIYAGVNNLNRAAAFVHPPFEVAVPQWNSTPGVYSGISGLSSSYWSNDQRAHQYQGGHTESHGGLSFFVDSDCNDLTVFGNTVHSTYSPCLA